MNNDPLKTQMVELTKYRISTISTKKIFTKMNIINEEKIPNKLVFSKIHFQSKFLIIFFLTNIIYFQFRKLIYK
jgi:hypothetical protein